MKRERVLELWNTAVLQSHAIEDPIYQFADLIETELTKEQEPLAWLHKNGLDWFHGPKCMLPNEEDWCPLYLAPPTPNVPDGWQIVPIEPTEKMLEAGNSASLSLTAILDDTHFSISRADYTAMLAAAHEYQGE